MYRPPLFREDRLEALHGLILANPLGLLIGVGDEGMVANPAPFLLDPDAAPYGTLRAHVARANPQWRDFLARPEALVVFQGADRYVTPNWYATKRETGKVVPTWNYAMVQVRGTVRVVEDAAWLADQIAALTDAQEAALPDPWAVSDAPEDFVAAQVRGIVGLELEIARIEGKWKVSQNRPVADRVGVVAGLEEAGDEAALAMARLVGGATGDRRQATGR